MVSYLIIYHGWGAEGNWPRRNFRVINNRGT
jgi:hypothetical protein